MEYPKPQHMTRRQREQALGVQAVLSGLGETWLPATDLQPSTDDSAAVDLD